MKSLDQVLGFFKKSIGGKSYTSNALILSLILLYGCQRIKQPNYHNNIPVHVAQTTENKDIIVEPLHKEQVSINDTIYVAQLYNDNWLPVICLTAQDSITKHNQIHKEMLINTFAQKLNYNQTAERFSNIWHQYKSLFFIRLVDK